MENFDVTMSVLRDYLIAQLNAIYKDLLSDAVSDDFLLFELSRLITSVFEVACGDDFNLDGLLEITDQFYCRGRAMEKLKSEEKQFHLPLLADSVRNHFRVRHAAESFSATATMLRTVAVKGNNITACASADLCSAFAVSVALLGQWAQLFLLI